MYQLNKMHLAQRRCASLLLVLLLLGIAACSSEEAAPVATPTTIVADSGSAESSAPESALAIVSRAELVMQDGIPVEIDLVVRGELPDGCTVIDQITQSRNGSIINVTVMTQRDADAICTQALTPYEERIALDIAGVPAGTYTVNVNGAIQSFVLAVDNVEAEPTIVREDPTPTPVPLPTATDGPTGVTIEGLVFHDLCAVGENDSADAPREGCVATADGQIAADGVLAAAEPGLVNVSVSISNGACPAGPALQSASTDQNGIYQFTDIAPGTYCVYLDTFTEPNASLLIPGTWTAPDPTGATTVEVTSNMTVTPFAWDYTNQPIPEDEQVDTLVEANCRDRVSFWGDVTVPDDTPFEPGDAINKVWRLINTGSCTWTTEYGLQFADGAQLGAPDFLPFDRLVPPGDQIDVAVTLTAPDELGTYRSDWLFRNGRGELQGLGEDIANTIWAQIAVVEPNTLGSISGVVWDDLCNSADYTFGDRQLPPGCFENENGTVRGDGIYDLTNEQPIEGVTVTLGRGECGDADPLTTTVTSSNGSYQFASLTPDTYCVYIEILTEANFPILIPGDFTFPAPSLAGTTIGIIDANDFGSINFGWDFAE